MRNFLYFICAIICFVAAGIFLGIAIYSSPIFCFIWSAVYFFVGAYIFIKILRRDRGVSGLWFGNRIFDLELWIWKKINRFILLPIYKKQAANIYAYTDFVLVQYGDLFELAKDLIRDKTTLDDIDSGMLLDYIEDRIY